MNLNSVTSESVRSSVLWLFILETKRFQMIFFFSSSSSCFNEFEPSLNVARYSGVKTAPESAASAGQGRPAAGSSQQMKKLSLSCCSETLFIVSTLGEPCAPLPSRFFFGSRADITDGSAPAVFYFFDATLLTSCSCFYAFIERIRVSVAVSSNPPSSCRDFGVSI